MYCVNVKTGGLEDDITRNGWNVEDIARKRQGMDSIKKNKERRNTDHFLHHLVNLRAFLGPENLSQISRISITGMQLRLMDIYTPMLSL